MVTVKRRGCSVRGCRNAHMSKGLCMTHYQRERRAALREKENAAGAEQHQRRDEEARAVGAARTA